MPSTLDMTNFVGDVFGTHVTPPNPRDLRQELLNTLWSTEEVMPRWAGAERTWLPYWAGTANLGLQAQLYGTAEAPGLLSEGNRAGRNTLRNLALWSPYTESLLGELGPQAAAENVNPYALSPAEVSQITQASVSNPALSGLGPQPRDAYLAYANLGSAAVERAAQRRNFATNVMGLEGLYRAQPALQMRNAILAAGLNRSTGPTLFDPYNQYAQDLYNTNYNAKAAARIATANNNAAMWSALFGAAGKAAA